MTISDSQGNVTYVEVVEPTCAHGTAKASYTTTDVAIATVYLWHMEVRIPPGHAGVTGLALVDSGHFILPFDSAGPVWLVGDDDLLQYDYNKELGNNIKLATYNTGIYDHTWQVRLIYTPMSDYDQTGAVLVVPSG